ncbi:putative RNA polymerase II subunit B1 CTD phosphatase rpap2 [Trichomycterus rosablanca]|uniref:putative RNA polymerase II subunit B1 CTD phosphatase rpap2 n=1 Tax=Trichomycterus rosablanca TaxID=2290929 RepID=UPI002F3517A0
MEAGEKRQFRSSKKRKKVGKAGQVRSAEEEARRREILKESLREKLELEKRALQVVERLLDENVSEDFLTDCVRLITPANYRDAVEERSIAKLCGYPVCSNTLTNVPSQQYKISTRTNKVYDITERKCFCSDFCFIASKHLEVQISKSPLWLRKEESPPDIKLMKKGDGGSSGVEVELTDRPVYLTEVESPAPDSSIRRGSSRESSDSEDEQSFVSSVVSGQCSRPRVHWGNLPKRHDEDGTKPTDRVESGRVDEATPVERGVEETTDLLDRCDLSDAPAQTANDAHEKAAEPGLNISEVGMSKKGAAGLKNLLKNHAQSRAEPPSVTLGVLEALRRTLTEWKTEETMRFLCGPGYTSQTKAVEQSKVEEEEELDEDDLEDPEEVPEQKRGSDQGGGGAEEGTHRPSAPAPDHQTLKKETEMLELRVQEFYKGGCVLPEEVQNLTAGESNHAQRENDAPPLPLVDSHAQHAIQRRIAVEKLCRSSKDVVGPLGVTMNEIINDINSLVRTFRFTNVNIIHKPPEWTLIALVLLSALTGVSPSLRDSMSRTSSLEFVSSLVKVLKLKDEDLRSLVLIFRPEGNVQPPNSDPPETPHC